MSNDYVYIKTLYVTVKDITIEISYANTGEKALSIDKQENNLLSWSSEVELQVLKINSLDLLDKCTAIAKYVSTEQCNLDEPDKIVYEIKYIFNVHSDG
jgi:hypothetical protein